MLQPQQQMQSAMPRLKRRLSVCDYASDEEVDSDELGSDLDGNRASAQQ